MLFIFGPEVSLDLVEHLGVVEAIDVSYFEQLLRLSGQHGAKHFLFVGFINISFELPFVNLSF